MEAEAPLQAPALVLPTQQQQQPGEQTSGLQPTVRRASRSLCSPPAGPFAFDSHDLAWEEGTYANTRFLSVTVPSDRIQDFVSGENTRGQTSFCVFKSERPWKAEHVSVHMQVPHRAALESTMALWEVPGRVWLLASSSTICDAGPAIEDKRAQQGHLLVPGEAF